jgi:hypothetical protein
MTPEIPDQVRQAFADRPFLCLSQLARMLGWDVATLRGHVERGNLAGRRKGHGKERTHRVFTLAVFPPSGAGYVRLPPQRLPQLAIRLRTRRSSIFGRHGHPKDRPKCEAQEFEKAERRKAVELVDAAKRENRTPLTLATAAERWWHEVGQYTEETDLEDALKWLIGQIGGKRGLHSIRDDDAAKAVAARIWSRPATTTTASSSTARFRPARLTAPSSFYCAG